MCAWVQVMQRGKCLLGKPKHGVGYRELVQRSDDVSGCSSASAGGHARQVGCVSLAKRSRAGAVAATDADVIVVADCAVTGSANADMIIHPSNTSMNPSLGASIEISCNDVTLTPSPTARGSTNANLCLCSIQVTSFHTNILPPMLQRPPTGTPSPPRTSTRYTSYAPHLPSMPALSRILVSLTLPARPSTGSLPRYLPPFPTCATLPIYRMVDNPPLWTPQALHVCDNPLVLKTGWNSTHVFLATHVRPQAQTTVSSPPAWHGVSFQYAVSSRDPPYMGVYDCGAFPFHSTKNFAVVGRYRLGGLGVYGEFLVP